MKLVQKRFLRETREFEIIDDETLYVRIKGFLKEEKLTVNMSLLNPEPVIKGSEMVFYSDFKGHPAFSMLINKPSKDEFNAFVDTLKKKISGDEDSTESGSQAGSMSQNEFDEPFWVKEPTLKEEVEFKPVIVERLVIDIDMLKTYLDENDIRPLLDVMHKLVEEPANEAIYNEMVVIFNDLGFYQGQVLTYGTYLKVLLSNHVTGKGLD